MRGSLRVDGRARIDEVKQLLNVNDVIVINGLLPADVAQHDTIHIPLHLRDQIPAAVSSARQALRHGRLGHCISAVGLGGGSAVERQAVGVDARHRCDSWAK